MLEFRAFDSVEIGSTIEPYFSESAKNAGSFSLWRLRRRIKSQASTRQISKRTMTTAVTVPIPAPEERNCPSERSGRDG